MKFRINTIGTIIIQRQTNELFTFVWGGILVLLSLYLFVRYVLDGQVIMYVIIALIFCLLYVVIPINLWIKLNKVILNLEIIDDKLNIETKKGKVKMQTYKILNANGSFSGLGKNHSNGYIIIDEDESKEYWLIATFFNEIEVIEKELIREK